MTPASASRARPIALMIGAIVLVGAVVSLFLFGSLFKDDAGRDRGGRGPSGPTSFRTVPLEKGRLVVAVEATGTLQPAARVEVGSRVGGLVSKVLVDFNDTVKAGQLLAEIDPAPLRARRDEARAAVSGARAELERAKADLVLKEQNAARAAELFEKKIATKAELEANEGARAMSVAQVQVANASLERASAALASTEADLAATRIVAPADGIVLSREVEAGQTVAASFQTPRLFVIAGSLERLEVIANVDEADLAAVRDGAEAEVTVDAYPGRTFKAAVKQIRISPKTEQGVVTFPVVLSVDNADKALLPGMTATARINGPAVDDALIVPSAALRFSPSALGPVKDTNPRIFILDNGAPKPIAVKVGAKANGRVQIISDEVAPDMKVIVDELGGPSRARSGAGGGGGGGGRGPPRIF